MCTHNSTAGKFETVQNLLRQLQEAHLGSHVPSLPHGVVMCGWQAGVGDGAACRRPHDALCQQEVAEETGYQQVLHCIHHIVSTMATMASYQSAAGICSCEEVTIGKIVGIATIAGRFCVTLCNSDM